MLRTTLAVGVAVVALTTPGLAGGATVHAPRRMPDLVGRSRAQVYRIMHDEGLYFVTRGPGAASATWVAVAAQSPRPGAPIAWHAQATLTVTTQSPRGPRPVPRLTGLTKAQVFAAMRRAALYFITVGPGGSNGRWNEVLAESPAPGTRVRWHSEVIVHVTTRAAKPPAPPAVQSTVVNGANFKVGVATWYNYIPGRCATWYLPKGTRLTVRDLATGKTITCIISDREDHTGNHVVDLSESQFSQLAPLWRGVISVRVSW